MFHCLRWYLWGPQIEASIPFGAHNHLALDSHSPKHEAGRQPVHKEDIDVRSCLDEKVQRSHTSNFGVISWTSWSALTYSFLLSRGLAFRNSLDQGSSRFHKQCGKKALLLTVAVPARDWWVRVIQNGIELAKTYIVGLTPRPLCQAKEPWRVFWECDCIARPDQCWSWWYILYHFKIISFIRKKRSTWHRLSCWHFFMVNTWSLKCSFRQLRLGMGATSSDLDRASQAQAYGKVEGVCFFLKITGMFGDQIFEFWTLQIAWEILVILFFGFQLLTRWRQNPDVLSQVQWTLPHQSGSNVWTNYVMSRYGACLCEISEVQLALVFCPWAADGCVWFSKLVTLAISE